MIFLRYTPEGFFHALSQRAAQIFAAFNALIDGADLNAIKNAHGAAPHLSAQSEPRARQRSIRLFGRKAARSSRRAPASLRPDDP